MTIIAARDTGPYGPAFARGLLRAFLIAGVVLLNGCSDDSHPLSGGSPTPTSAGVFTATATAVPSRTATLIAPTPSATAALPTFTAVATATSTSTEPPATVTPTSTPSTSPTQDPVDRANAVLAQMTLDEKVAFAA